MGQGSAELVADFAGDGFGVGNHTGQITISIQPLDRCFWAAAVYAGHVVHFVAGQREVIDDLRRRNPKFSQHPSGVQHFVAHGVEQGHLGVDQLRHVFVAGRNPHLPAQGHRLHR